MHMTLLRLYYTLDRLFFLRHAIRFSNERFCGVHFSVIWIHSYDYQIKYVACAVQNSDFSYISKMVER